MPIDTEKSSGDVIVNVNGTNDVLFIFGSAYGSWDFPAITEHASQCDVYSFRSEKNSWFEEAGNSFASIEEMEAFVVAACTRYSGKKIFLGISMGGSAAIYFGTGCQDAIVVAASPQLFQFQFLWSPYMKPKYLMIERMIGRMQERVCAEIEIIICSGRSDKEWNWRDREAAFIVQDMIPLRLSVYPCNGHEVWQNMSMRKAVEAHLGHSIF